MGRTIGIDLGTTNSAVCVKKIKAAAVLNAQGEDLTPSCVTAVPDPKNSGYQYVVGRDSRNLLKQYPEQTITSVKRLMGREFEDPEVQNIIKDRRVSYQITTDISEPGSIRIPLGEKMQTPEMISGMILKKLISDSETELQDKITQAVVTTPAYFSDSQKFATRAACDYANIKLLRLLPEPTAAALAFGLELSKEDARTIMVFDLGGGTFDISVLSFAGGSFMEVTKGGDMWLGGDNIDQLLVDHALSVAQKEANCSSITALIDGLPSASKARFLVELKEKAEAAKIALSTKDKTTVDLFGVLKDSKNQLIDIDVAITRAEFDDLLVPMRNRISEITKQILHEIRFEPELIDTVLMVGGSSHIPAIQDELKKLFGAEKVMVHTRPMHAVAEGASIMATKLASQEDVNGEQSFSIMHTTAHNYYLCLADGKRYMLVEKNTPLPISVEEKLTFAHKDQSLARLRVLNEADGVLDTVGELWFHKDDSNQAQKDNNKLTEIMLGFSIDENNIITMKASSLQNAELSVETKIARGGLAAKLYNDLEKTLSDIISSSKSATVESDALQLSRTIVSTILSVSDPVTGETRPDKKKKVQQQIVTLKGLQQTDIAPLAMYRFAAAAQITSKDILSSQEKERFQKIITKLKSELDDLENFEKIIELCKELKKFYKDVPVVSNLERAELVAAEADKDYPSGAKHIRQKIKKIIKCYADGDKAAMNLEQDELNYFLASEFTWDNDPSGRFDRDVKKL